jgi:integrase
VLNAIKAEAARGFNPAADPKLNVGDYLDTWLLARRGIVGSGIRESTWRENARHVEQYISPELGGVLLKRLDRTTVRAWAGRLRADRGLAPGTVLNAVRTLSKALTDAMEDGILDRNVALGVWKVKPAERKRGVAWPQEELRRFVRGVEHDRLYALWRLLLAVGCRRGEALGLNWDHVDMRTGVVTIAQAYVSGINGYSIQPTKTGLVRRVTVDEGTLIALRSFFQTQRFERRALGIEDPLPSDAPVFVNRVGQRLHPDGVSTRWVELCESVGVKRIRLHDARHSAATALLDRRVPVHQVSAVLGHSTPATTHATYSHVIDAVGDGAAAVMSEVLDGDDESEAGARGRSA